MKVLFSEQVEPVLAHSTQQGMEEPGSEDAVGRIEQGSYES